ncbi:hypothetical protein HNY73_005566 [Argiope bruennichi]|uniref:Uncharacterized protein n=1 Tax=Argiope bruennichi TaxID=94029 RepID=A0A8T0FHT5_ARGBR|nr:hypothetical protein HNY73_005566 [Argiope bruennichi]
MECCENFKKEPNVLFIVDPNIFLIDPATDRKLVGRVARSQSSAVQQGQGPGLWLGIRPGTARFEQFRGEELFSCAICQARR